MGGKVHFRNVNLSCFLVAQIVKYHIYQSEQSIKLLDTNNSFRVGKMLAIVIKFLFKW